MAGSTHSYEHLEDEVLHLPREDRSKLASRILESLDEDDFQLTPGWRAELQRRADETKSIPSEEVWKEANQRFGTTF